MLENELTAISLDEHDTTCWDDSDADYGLLGDEFDFEGNDAFESLEENDSIDPEDDYFERGVLDF